MRALRAAHRGTIPQQAAPGHAGCARKDASTYFHTQVIQKSSERRTLFPSPLAGEGDRAEAKPSEVGRGAIFRQTFLRSEPLSRIALAIALRDPPSPARGEGKRVCRTPVSPNSDSEYYAASSLTYSKSPGRLSMPTRGGAIHEANWPGSLTGFISEAMNSPSASDGSHWSFCLAQVAASTSTPDGVAWTSLNSPMSRWKATCGSARRKSTPIRSMILLKRSMPLAQSRV